MRELDEEVALNVTEDQISPLMEIPFNYPDKKRTAGRLLGSYLYPSRFLVYLAQGCG